MKKFFSFLFISVASVGVAASGLMSDDDQKQLCSVVQKIGNKKAAQVCELLQEVVFPILEVGKNLPECKREDYLKLLDDQCYDKMALCAEKNVKPYLQKIIDENKNEKAVSSAKYLLEELKSVIQTDTVGANGNMLNVSYIQDLLLRYLLSVSEMSEDEYLVMFAASGTDVYKKFFEEDVWKSRERYTAIYKEFFGSAHRSSRQKNVMLVDVWEGYEETLDYIKSSIHKYNPNILLPFLDTRFFHPSLMIALKMNNIQPVAVPSVSVETGAHGVNEASLFGHSFHDGFHDLITDVNGYLVYDILRTCSKAFYSGKDIKEFREGFVPLALEQHRILGRLFMTILEKHLDAINKMEDKETKVLRNSLAGYFLAVNEHPGWNASMYEETSPTKIIELFKENAKKHLEDSLSWENPEDMLVTSHVNGSTNATDEEIINTAIDKEWIAKDASENITILRHNRFVEITSEKQDGSLEKAFFPTLHHKILNSRDNINLFRYAGSDITPFEKTPQTREEVITYLNGVLKLVINSLDGFYTTSRDFLDAPMYDESPEQTVGSFYEGQLKEVITKKQRLLSMEDAGNPQSFPEGVIEGEKE